jgi:hypothetical protein
MTATPSIETILAEHLKRYPLMQPDDLYKLIMQAAMGSEHAFDDAESAKLYFQNEIDGLSLDRDDPLVDPLSPEGLIVRVNLRPLVKAGEELDELLEAFIRTASMYTGDLEALRSYFETAISMASAKKLPFRVDELRALIADMERANYPAIHHSTIYQQAYQPAYRVILSTLFPALTDGKLR